MYKADAIALGAKTGLTPVKIQFGKIADTYEVLDMTNLHIDNHIDAIGATWVVKNIDYFSDLPTIHVVPLE
jgi:hypothetical protein